MGPGTDYFLWYKIGEGLLYLVCDGTANFIEFERLRTAISGGCIIMWGEEKEGVGFFVIGADVKNIRLC